MNNIEFLCNLADIEAAGSLGFTLHDRSVFLVWHEHAVKAFLNRCPHLGTPLEFTPDRFLSFDKKWIICSTHGALFDKRNGHCVHGPCQGESLLPVPIIIEQSAIYINIDLLLKLDRH